MRVHKKRLKVSGENGAVQVGCGASKPGLPDGFPACVVDAVHLSQHVSSSLGTFDGTAEVSPGENAFCIILATDQVSLAG